MSLGFKKCAAAHVHDEVVVRYSPLGLKPWSCVYEVRRHRCLIALRTSLGAVFRQAIGLHWVSTLISHP